jgi:thiosulfate dehydrogenase (quinone) large subunit
MSVAKAASTSKPAIERLEDPGVAKAIFGEVRWSWIWLILRLYVGYEWLSAGLGKLSNPVWAGNKAGVAITGFVKGALSKTSGDHPDVQGWYAWFLNNAVLPAPVVWSYLITFGEILVGIALILGLFTGLAAFFGSFMNVNYLLAGTVSTNPILFIIATWLVLSWKTAGWLGLDHWVLPALGKHFSPSLVLADDSSGSNDIRPLENASRA